MSTLRTFSNLTAPLGETILGPFALPPNLVSVQITTATTWPAASAGSVMSVEIETSADAGATWVSRCRAHYVGGVNPRTGLPPPGPSLIIQFDPPLASVGLGRVRITMIQALLFSTITVEATP